jgi:hypothetical protein
MELRLEAAYYRAGTTERVIANYLGTEAITFAVSGDGSLRAMPAPQGTRVDSSVAARPPGQRPSKACCHSGSAAFAITVSSFRCCSPAVRKPAPQCC